MDEQYGKKDNKKFSAVIATVWHADSLIDYRTDLVMLTSDRINEKENTFNPFTRLHGSNMAEGSDLEDRDKLYLYHIVA